ncbi:hypothetical protein ACLMAJ_25935 [Nocardia sp. KC 131]|uniref:hypothetical protein n=1 Tax=Nocardia arseniciresistens TaxID=3392119 RepID=UPI00398E70BD
MTEREHLNTVESITIVEFFDELGNYYADQAGDADAGWDRVERALQPEEKRPIDPALELDVAMTQTITNITRALIMATSNSSWPLESAAAMEWRASGVGPDAGSGPPRGKKERRGTSGTSPPVWPGS